MAMMRTPKQLRRDFVIAKGFTQRDAGSVLIATAIGLFFAFAVPSILIVKFIFTAIVALASIWLFMPSSQEKYLKRWQVYVTLVKKKIDRGVLMPEREILGNREKGQK